MSTETRLMWTTTCLITLCLVWLVPFIGILKYGSHLVQEPSMAVLVTEIALLVGLVGFGISNIIHLRRKIWLTGR